MNYIVLAAGKGLRLNPLTKQYPKCLYKLNDDLTIAHMLVNNIRIHDPNANIIFVTGFMNKLLEDTIKDVIFVYNPFYEFTNSIASLWFAKDYLVDHVTIINSDVVFDKRSFQEVISKTFDYPLVLLDSSIKRDGDYNVQVNGDYVVVMSKDLKTYHGEYAGVTKLNPKSTILLLEEIKTMVSQGYYDQWYENALVQLIFSRSFNLYYKDILDYMWTEVDTVDDLLKAKDIASSINSHK